MSSQLKDQQEGVVSMIIVMLIMILLTLTVLAMSQNATREQRQAIDRQLSDQAYYNAESGVNDTIKWLFDNPAAPPENNSCNLAFLGGGFIDTDGTNRYTCILYNKNPKTIEFDNLPVNDSKTVQIQTLDPATGNPVTLRDLTISWDDANANNTVSGCNFGTGSPPLPVGLPAGMPNCTIGGVRMDLSPFQASRDAITQNSFNAFLLPNFSSGGSVDRSVLGGYPNSQGVIGQARCNGPQPGPPSIPRTCYLTITNLNLPPSSLWYLHIRSLYNSTDVSISGVSSAGQPVGFLNAQIMIDSTGRANDILRRIQVRVPALPQFRQAEFGLQTRDSICKLLRIDINTVTPADPVNCPVPAP